MEPRNVTVYSVSGQFPCDGCSCFIKRFVNTCSCNNTCFILQQDSYQVMIGKRMRRGNRKMADKRFGVTLLFSLTILRPLHSVMATLFRQSKEIEADISEIATCINDTMHNLAVLAMTSVFLSSEGWHVLHLAQNGRENLQTLEFRRYMRKELLRVVGGFCMRMVHVFNQKHVQLFIALEKCGDADLEEGIRRCQFPACCLPPAVSSFHKWAETASIASLRAVKRLWTPYILKTERDHAGNQRRQARASHKARTWKRQVATYVCVRSKHHWAQLSQTYRLRQRCLSNMSWKALAQRRETLWFQRLFHVCQ